MPNWCFGSLRITCSEELRETIRTYVQSDEKVFDLNRIMGAIIDKFGRQNYARPVDDRHFEVTVSVAISPQFYGWVFGLKNYVTITAPQDVVEGIFYRCHHTNLLGYV